VSGKWDNVYVAMCGELFTTRAAGVRHEQYCSECLREIHKDESDDDSGAAEDAAGDVA
jgi:hypothetical protein